MQQASLKSKFIGNQTQHILQAWALWMNPSQQQQPQTGEISAITDPGVVSLSLQFVLLALQLNSAY